MFGRFKKCCSCKNVIMREFKVCPICGEKQRRWLKWSIITASVIIVSIGLYEGYQEVIKYNERKEDRVEEKYDVDDMKLKAVEKVNEYVKSLPLSRIIIIEQLEFEGFSKEDAEYGADNCSVDWKAQALRAGKDFKNKGVSKDIVEKQLESEGFTEEEIEYAIKRL